MGWFINERKVKAAANSMHQFCQVVRSIFPGHTDDGIIESATIFLYVSLSRDLFGRRFAECLSTRLRDRLKYATVSEVKTRIARIARQADDLERAAVSVSSPRCSPQEKCRNHVTSVIESLLLEAGFRSDDPQLLKETYPRFEDVVRGLKTHLLGIKEQNAVMMKRTSPR